MIVLPGLFAPVTCLDVVGTIGEVTMTGVEDTLGRGDVALCCGKVWRTCVEVGLCRGEVGMTASGVFFFTKWKV